MKALGAPSAKGLSPEATHIRGPTEHVSAKGLSRAENGPFSKALKNVIRRAKRETVSASDRPDAGKSLSADIPVAARLFSVPDSDGAGFCFVPECGGNGAAQMAFTMAIDSSALSRQLLADVMTETVVPQWGNNMTESAAITGLPLAGWTGEEAGFLWETSPMAVPETASVPEAITYAQDQHLRFDGVALESFWGNTQKFMAKGQLTGEEATLQDFPSQFAENAFGERQGEGLARVAAHFSAEMPDLAQNATFAPDTLLGRGLSEEPSNLTKALLPENPFDNMLVRVFPEQPAQPTVTHVVGVEREHLFDQLIQGVRVAQHAGTTEMLVHLKPDSLGRLSIRVLAGEQAMRVEIRAESEVVRQVMQDNLADLQQRLADKGLSFSQFSILADTGWHTRQETEWSFDGPTTHPELEISTEVMVEPTPLKRSGMIDYLA